MIITNMVGITITILLDSGAASNHIKRELVCKLGLVELDRAIPLIINGFGDTKSKIITKIAQINLLSKNRSHGLQLYCNIIEDEIISNLPGVGVEIYEEFPHLLDHREYLTAPIPRPSQNVDIIIGVRDKPKLFINNNGKGLKLNKECETPCYIEDINGQGNYIQVTRCLFGDVIEGGMSEIINADKNKKIKNKNEATMSIKELFLDAIMVKAFKAMSEADDNEPNLSLIHI